MNGDIRIYYVQASGLVVAYGTMRWEDSPTWDPAIYAVDLAPATLPDVAPITLGPGPAVVYNWRYDPATGTVSHA